MTEKEGLETVGDVCALVGVVPAAGQEQGAVRLGRFLVVFVPQLFSFLKKVKLLLCGILVVLGLITAVVGKVGVFRVLL